MKMSGVRFEYIRCMMKMTDPGVGERDDRELKKYRTRLAYVRCLMRITKFEYERYVGELVNENMCRVELSILRNWESDIMFGIDLMKDLGGEFNDYMVDEKRSEYHCTYMLEKLSGLHELLFRGLECRGLDTNVCKEMIEVLDDWENELMSTIVRQSVMKRLRGVVS